MQDILSLLRSAAFTAWGAPTSWAELLGFISGAVCVWLVARQNIWTWPIGLVNNALFFFLFLTAKLYADASLQVVFGVLAIYGWYRWLHPDSSQSQLRIRRTTTSEWVALGFCGVLGVSAATWWLSSSTDSPVPFWDSSVLVLSLIATYGQANKLLESWWVWIAVDVISIPLYVSRSLYLTAILYAAFLAICIFGLLTWSRELTSHRGRWQLKVIAIFLLVAGVASASRLPGQATEPRPQREVAVTFDDLPGVAMLRSQRCNARAFAEMNGRLLRSIKAHRVPATGLVVEGKLCAGGKHALTDILDMWLDAGLDLGNHSFSHFDLNDTPLASYQADVIRGETVTAGVLRQTGRQLKYFRHPYLHAGKDLKTKTAFDKFLAGRGYRVAPVTIDNQEWVFAEVYAMARERGDKETAERVTDAYIAHMESVFEFFERRSVEVVGYEIKQVLLLHANPLNADHLDRLIEMMKGRGYSFITLDRALTDRAYRLPDNYAGPQGLSWLHRWALTKGMKMKQEPREPAFITALFRNYPTGQVLQ